MQEQEKSVIEQGSKRYVPSRFNVQAKCNNGGLLIYNTLSGAMGNILPENRKLVENALKLGIEEEPQEVLKELYER